jgi:quercetin dioxygenase-like cupin family protein
VVTETTDVRLRIVQSEFDEGFDSGWHTHPGPVIVQVQEGLFKIYQDGCEPIAVHEGESYIEVPLVPVRAVAKGRIRWTTSQILPDGEAAQEPSVPPCQ